MATNRKEKNYQNPRNWDKMIIGEMIMKIRNLPCKSNKLFLSTENFEMDLCTLS